LIVAGLAIAALWRIGPPPQQTATAVGTTGGSAERVLTTPVKTIAELLSNNAVGREASLEHVTIRERVGDRYFWIGSGDERPVFVVLDPDVKRHAAVTLRAGARVTLIGIVHPAPKAVEAQQQWHVTAATGMLIEESGTYLHVTEIRE
jgi:phosphoribosylformylglycinamidine (FGAM) synthase-like enzyme